MAPLLSGPVLTILSVHVDGRARALRRSQEPLSEVVERVEREHGRVVITNTSVPP